MDQYLKCTDTIDCDNETVKAKAQEIVRGLETDREKAKALYYFVRDEFKHNPFIPYHILERYKASATLKEGDGWCQHKAILLAALARAVGIPSRIGFVDIREPQMSESFRQSIGGIDVLPFHGYAELYVNDRWIHVSPAYDLATCQKKRFVPVDFDGINDAKDSSYTEDGRPHIEHVKDHGSYDDFPWDEIIAYYQQWTVKQPRE